MKYIKGIVYLIISMTLLGGCASEESLPHFTLTDMGAVNWGEDTPYMYEVNSNRARNQVIIFSYEKISEDNYQTIEETYDLEHASVTDDEIVIEYDGETVIFERLSSSVVQNEDRQQYQYFGPIEEQAIFTGGK